MKMSKLIVIAAMSAVSSTAFAEHWKFAVSGDSRGSTNGVNTAILGNIAKNIASSGAEFVLMPGDLFTGVNDAAGTQTMMDQFKSTMAASAPGLKYYPVPGNHEWTYSGLPTIWQNAFDLPTNGPTGQSEMAYSFTNKNAFFVGIDSTRGLVAPQTWLNQQFAANNQPHVFVFGHHPAFQANHTDTLDDHPAERNAFIQSIADEGGRTYFAGHDHFYARASFDIVSKGQTVKFQHNIVGTAGAPLYSFDGVYSGDMGGFTLKDESHTGSYGYDIVDINDDLVTVTFYKYVSPDNYVVGDAYSYSVPEPASMGLLALGALGLLRRRRI